MQGLDPRQPQLEQPVKQKEARRNERKINEQQNAYMIRITTHLRRQLICTVSQSASQAISESVSE